MFFELQSDHCRFVYNKLLEQNIEQYNQDKTFTFGMGLSHKVQKLRKEFPWLKETISQCQQQSAMNLGKAFKNCFVHKTGKFPIFKSKKSAKQSFRIPQHFKIKKSKIHILKAGWISFRKDRNLNGKVKSLNISKDVDQWYVSILCEIEQNEIQIDQSNVVGLDVGIKEFCSTSDGEFLNLPDTSKETKRLKLLQKRHAKKKKGSNNKEKARIKVAKQYRKIRRIRENAINNMVSSITKNYDIVCIEDLNINGMKKNRKLSNSIQQNPWGIFVIKLHTKAKYVHKIGRWIPSSKTCSCCGWKNTDLKLSDRIFVCNECNNEMDRDINAAINIRNDYLKTDGMSGLACGETTIGDSTTESRYVSVKQEVDFVGNH